MNDCIGVSVVMPAFNAEKTIEYAIHSVLMQTHANLELIIVDDCSTDSTVDVVKNIATKDERIRLVCNTANCGVSYVRNIGVRESKYEFVAFIDSDDAWTADKLESQIETLLSHTECSICYTATSYITENGRMASYTLSVPEKTTYNDILKQNIISCSSVLARRDALLAFPMLDNRNIHEDFATWLGILSVTPYAVGVNKPMLIYRISRSGKSGNKIKAAKMQWRTYRICKVPLIKSVYCLFVYAWRNIVKYSLLKRSVE